MRHFLSVDDVTDIDELVAKALYYKKNPQIDNHIGKGKRLGLLFLNPSLRTRLSTQIAASNLGMESIVFNVDKDGWALEFEDGVVMNGTTVEHVKDAAPVLGSYFDILGIRTFPSLTNKEADYSELYINQFVKYANIPVISLESATLHPLQSLADIVTIKEELDNFPLKTQRKPKIVLSWAPHVKPLPQCVANSFAQWINAWGQAEFVITHPEGYNLHPKFCGNATITSNQTEALKGADFIYVKNWSSYSDYGKILSISPKWMLDLDKLKETNQAKVMHCLPVRRNIELSDQILDSQFSLVKKEAENRIYAAQSVLYHIL